MVPGNWSIAKMLFTCNVVRRMLAGAGLANQSLMKPCP